MLARHRPLAWDRQQFEAGLRQQAARIPALPGPLGEQHIIRVDNAIPQLAWLGVRRGQAYSFVLGRGVERFANGFFEGGWVGDFGNFDEVADKEHFGSGVLFDASNPLFIPHKNPREFIFILRDKRAETDFISNSLCFCFAAAHIARSDAIFQEADNELVESTHVATALGVHRYNPVVAETDRHLLLRLFHNNFRFTAKGGLAFDQPFTGRSFTDFESYNNYLSNAVASAFANVTDARRKRPLPPITTVSGGYDSTGVTALAREHGCNEAITLGVAVYGIDDSGTAIAEHLKMHVRTFAHVAGAAIHDLRMNFDGPLREQAYEFLATAGIGDDITFAAFEPALEGRLMLTGAGGDALWEKSFPLMPGLPVSTRFGKSLTEYRLRVGFAHFSPVNLGALSPASILRISSSAEMRPYSIGGRYDRPIPRRLAEEVGIPREMFGIQKSATSPDPLNHSALWAEAVERVMSRYTSAI